MHSLDHQDLWNLHIPPPRDRRGVRGMVMTAALDRHGRTRPAA
jgi:hypothetical protein